MSKALSHIPLSLHQYWQSDFSNMLKLTEVLQISKGGQRINIGYRNIFQDHGSNTQFIGFFINENAETFKICSSLSGSVDEIINAMTSTVITKARGAADSMFTSSEDLTFSRRVFIYHESELTFEQLGLIEWQFKLRNLHAQFRGQNYATTSWLRDKSDNGLTNHKPLQQSVAPIANDSKISRRPTEEEVTQLAREVYNESPVNEKPNHSKAEKRLREKVQDSYTKPAGKCSKEKEDIIRVVLRKNEFASQRRKAGKRIKP